jgi:hypothetical protein
MDHFKKAGELYTEMSRQYGVLGMRFQQFAKNPNGCGFNMADEHVAIMKKLESILNELNEIFKPV